MPRLALGIGLALLVAAGAVWGLPYLTQDRHDYYATTPQPKPLVTASLVPLRPGARACLDRAVVDRYSDQARLLVYLHGRPAVPLELSLAGGGYHAAARVPATYADSRPVEVAVRPPAHAVAVTICVRNAGSRRVALFASDDRTKSRSRDRVDGRPVAANFDIVFTERRPVSILERLPASVQRASAFRFFGVAPLTLWPLLILFAVGVPLAVLLTFARTLEGAAEPLPGPAAPFRPRLRVPRVRLERPALHGALAVPWLWLGGALLVGLIAAVVYVLQFSQYVVMPDELGYMKQAVWFAQHLAPSTQGDPWFSSSAQLGPLLFSPAYGLFGAPTAFDLSHVISAVVFLSTAAPVFLLARSVTRDSAAAVLAAALSVVVPWLAMTASLMTEPIAYPALAWGLLAMTRALERPSWRRDLIALLAILVAALARAQLAILGPAFVVAAVVFHLRPAIGGPRLAGAVRAHWPLAVATVAGAVALASPGIRGALLGSYDIPLTGKLLPPGTWSAGRELLAYVVVGIGGLPLGLALAWIALTLVRPASASARAFAAVGLSVGVLLVVMTGSFTVGYAAGFNDRYLFFIVPVLVVAATAMLVERRPATLAIAVAGVLGGAIIAASQLAQYGPSLVSPSQTFHQVLLGRTAQLASALGARSLSMPVLVGVLVALAAVALAVARRRWSARRLGLAVAVALLVANAVQTGYTLYRTAATQTGVSAAFVSGRDWLDRDVPGDAPIAAVLGTVRDPTSTPVSWWDLEFWSKRLDRLYLLPGGPDGQGFGIAAALDPRTGRLSGLDDRALIVTSGQEKRFQLRGARAVAARNGFVVWQAPRPYRAAWSLAAQSDVGDIAVGHTGRLRVFGDGHAGVRQLTLTVRTSPGAEHGHALRARAGGVTRSLWVPLRRSRVVRLPVDVPATGAAQVRLDVSDRHPGAGAPQPGLRIANVALARAPRPSAARAG